MLSLLLISSTPACSIVIDLFVKHRIFFGRSLISIFVYFSVDGGPLEEDLDDDMEDFEEVDHVQLGGGVPGLGVPPPQILQSGRIHSAQ